MSVPTEVIRVIVVIVGYPREVLMCRRDEPDHWGGFEVHNVLGAGFLEAVYTNTKAIDPVHRAQVSNYLHASGLKVGLVMNFSSSVQFKRVVASPHRVRDGTKIDRETTTARPHADAPRSRR